MEREKDRDATGAGSCFAGEPDSKKTKGSSSSSTDEDQPDPWYIALLKHIASMRNSLIEEGFLCPSRLQDLEDLEDLENPDFLHEQFSSYFKATDILYAGVEKTLNKEPGFTGKEAMKTLLEGLKFYSDDVGARKISNEIDNMLQLHENGDSEGTRSAFKQVRAENTNLRMILHPYFQLLFRRNSYEIVRRTRLTLEGSKPQAGPSLTAERPEPQVGQSGTGERTKPQTGTSG